MNSNARKISIPWINKDVEIDILRLSKSHLIKPKISVVVANYNREDNLDVLLKSVITQSFTENLEIIVVDDKSKDKSIKKVLGYPNVGLVQLKENSGSEALPQNIGVYLSRGEYIGFVDSDDYLLSSKSLEGMCRALDRNRKATMAISNVIFQVETKNLGDMGWVLKHEKYMISKDKNICVNYQEKVEQLLKRNSKSYSLYELLTHGYHVGFRVMRKDALKEIGGWPIELGPSDDFGVIARFAEIEHKDPERKILPVDIDCYAYRITGVNVSFTKNQDKGLYQKVRKEVITRINSAGLKYSDLEDNASIEFWARWDVKKTEVLR